MQIPINEVFQNFFIGRKDELFLLEDRGNFILESGEHLVYSLLNTPGIGKTTLLNYFGENLMKNKNWIKIDSGKDLEKILGKKLYQRIFNVKTNL
ncbi:MAG: hypothetical protein ACP6IY_22050 [Promethearchaeia archaeon]